MKIESSATTIDNPLIFQLISKMSQTKNRKRKPTVKNAFNAIRRIKFNWNSAGIQAKINQKKI